MENRKPRVLIVDDQARNIQVVGNILIADDLDIAFATDGKRALELVSSQEYDLILLDIMMPGIDGLTVCRELREDPRTAETPVIFLTARSDPSSILLGFAAGANDYVTKPFNSAELKARVHTHLELHRQKKQLRNLNRNLESLVKARTRELEAALRQLSLLEKSKSEFLAIISHELRGPLSGIIGVTELLKSNTTDAEHLAQLELLADIARRLARFAELASLITSLRSSNGMLETMPSLIHIPLENAVAQSRKLLEEKQISIQWQMSRHDLTLEIDPEMFRRCIEILLENAVANLPQGTFIKLSTETFENELHISLINIDQPFTNEFLQSVNDYLLTGQLIADENAGLSLAAVKLMLDANGGRLSISNRPEGGCISLVFDNIAHI